MADDPKHPLAYKLRRFLFMHFVAVRHVLGQPSLAIRHPKLRWWGGLYWGEIKWKYRNGEY